MKTTPMQAVKKQFGDRASLVDAIMPLIESKDDELRSKFMGTSNKKLLRIYETATKAQEKFGSRKNLIDQLTTLRYPNGNPDDGFLKRVNESSVKRLLDMHRQAGGE